MIDYRFRVLHGGRDVLVEVYREEGDICLEVEDRVRCFTEEEFREFVTACAKFLDEDGGES